MKNIIIYGGTFDPPHNGHLNTAIAVQNSFHFDRFLFLPCRTPVLKKAALSSNEQRILMLKLAIENYHEFEIDLREMTRNTPSFMVETLENIRQELGHNSAITLCLGSDAFMQLPQWHKSQQILKLANLLVIKRAQISEQHVSEIMSTLLHTHETFIKNDLLTCPNGKIYQFDAGQYLISSRWIRAEIKAGHDMQSHLPKSVYEYIKAQALYR